MSRANAYRGGPRAAVIEDHPLFRQSLCDFLARQFQMTVVIETASMAQALRQMRETEVNFAVVDLNVEDSGGANTVAEIHTRYPHLPILVVSAYDEHTFAERALRSGARGYLSKRQTGKELAQAVRTVLRGDIYASPQVANRLFGKSGSTARGRRKTQVDALTDRELEIFGYIGDGLSTKQIAEKLHRSVKTIEAHKDHIKMKLWLDSATALRHAALDWTVQSKWRGASATGKETGRK